MPIDEQLSEQLVIEKAVALALFDRGGDFRLRVAATLQSRPQLSFRQPPARKQTERAHARAHGVDHRAELTRRRL